MYVTYAAMCMMKQQAMRQTALLLEQSGKTCQRTLHALCAALERTNFPLRNKQSDDVFVPKIQWENWSLFFERLGVL